MCHVTFAAIYQNDFYEYYLIYYVLYANYLSIMYVANNSQLTLPTIAQRNFQGIQNASSIK